MKPLAAAVALALAAPAGAADDVRLDRILSTGNFHGVALVGIGDSIAWSRAAGEVRPGVPHRIDAVWRLASITKQLTALLVMQEVAAGRLALDRPIRDFWPDWPGAQADRLTVRMLLRHESGLADPNLSPSAANDDVPDFYRRTGAAAEGRAAAMGFCAAVPRAEPGAGYHYNNCDYIVLGALLEELSGKSLAALVRDRLAVPLGRDTLGLFDPQAAQLRETVPGILADGRDEPALNLASYGGAGAGFATAEDLWHFDRALMDDRLLDRADTALMWTGDPAIGSAAFGAWSYATALPNCPAPVTVVERRGMIGGVQGRNFLVPAARLALILFTSRGGFNFGEVWQGRGFAHAMLAAALCPEGR